MIRVLHIVHAITPGGGLSNMIMNYYRFIDREKIQFDFLYFRKSDDTFEGEINALGGYCYYLNEPSLSLSFFKERESFFKKHKGEWHVVHCHALFAAALLAQTAKKYGASHIISHSHSLGYGEGNFIKHYRNRFFVYEAKRLGDTHLACSRNAAAFMFGESELNSGKAVVINNAIDLDKYWFDEEVRKKIRRDLNIDNKFVIGHVGGFTAQKNHVFLLDVFNEFQKKHPESILLLVGADGIANGSTKSLIASRVDDYGISSKVKFLGFRSDVNILNQAMDAFLFPSIHEGLGIVLVEAQASGLPCVVSPAIPDEVALLGTFSKMDNLTDVSYWVNVLESKMNMDITQRYVNRTSFEKYDITKQCHVLEEIYSSGV